MTHILHLRSAAPNHDWQEELLSSSDRRTVRVALSRSAIANDIAPVLLVDAIAAVQDAGYLVYEKSELPEVTVVNGKPKLPSSFGQDTVGMNPRPFGRPKAQLFYEEAFGKLALAQWWEAEERRREKRVAALDSDLMEAGARDGSMAVFLVERGWRHG